MEKGKQTEVSVSPGNTSRYGSIFNVAAGALCKKYDYQAGLQAARQAAIIQARIADSMFLSDVFDVMSRIK
jgi:hypothetical protein